MDKAKLNYLLDAVIALGFATSFLSLSRGTWSELHTVASLVVIAGVAVHVVFHWRWILCVTKKMLPARSPRATQALCPVEA